VWVQLLFNHVFLCFGKTLFSQILTWSRIIDLLLNVVGQFSSVQQSPLGERFGCLEIDLNRATSHGRKIEAIKDIAIGPN
jgi:hypothetical protein